MNIVEQQPLAPRTTFGVGGVAEYFAQASNVTEVQELIAWANNRSLPVTILGGGSNVIVPDEEVKGLVLTPNIMSVTWTETEAGATVTAGAGVGWDDLVEMTTTRGYWGLEHLSGIPGLVGAAPIQNINAYGHAVADTITTVTAIDRTTGEERVFRAEECQFGYRDSIFKRVEGKPYIITEVGFALTRDPASVTNYQSSSQSLGRYLKRQAIEVPAAADVRAGILELRSNIGMLAGQFQSAGSFFKNTIVTNEQFAKVSSIIKEYFSAQANELAPWFWEQADGTVKISTAFLLECTPYNKTAFAGELFNNAVGISPRHSLSIINSGGASAADIDAFARTIEDTVFTTFGITLEREVQWL